MPNTRSKKISAEWRKNNKAYVREYAIKRQLKSAYNMTLQQYDDLLEAQGYVCAICFKPEKVMEVRTGIVRRLAVDHCHQTNRIRGLLCSNCNTALGLMKDDRCILLNALVYLDNK